MMPSPEPVSPTPSLQGQLNALNQASLEQRVVLLPKFAEALSSVDRLTANYYTDLAKANGLIPSKKVLLDAIADCRTKTTSAASLLDRPPFPTDDILVGRWRSVHPDTKFGLGGFRRYSPEGIWKLIPEQVIENEIHEILIAAKDEGVKPSDPLTRNISHWLQSELYMAEDQWDRRVGFVPVKNGVIDLDTGGFHSHDRDKFLISHLGYDYDEDAKCPNYVKILSRTMPPPVQAFWQEFLGLCLTTSNEQELFVCLFGPPGSGKSSALLGLQVLLGPQAGVLGIEELQRGRFALANIVGKTALYSTEQPRGPIDDLPILRKLCSCETVTVEQKYQPAFEYRSMAKVVFAMNELPRFKNPQDPMLRRMVKIAFLNLEKEKRDPALKKAIEQEAPGILNFALVGLARSRERGYIQIPPNLQDAEPWDVGGGSTESQFIKDECVRSAGVSTNGSDIYEAYKKYCEAHGAKPKNNQIFAGALRREGINNSKVRGLSRWNGIRLGKGGSL